MHERLKEVTRKIGVNSAAEGCRSTAPRLGLETVSRPARPLLQQMQSLLRKFGFLRMRSRNSACISERGRGPTRAF